MKILTKILLPPAVALVLMLLLGLVGYSALTTVRSTLSDVESLNNDRLAYLTKTRIELLEANFESYRLMLWIGDLDESTIKKNTEKIDTHINKAEAALQQWQGASDEMSEEKKSLTNISEILGKYRKSVLQAIDLASSDPSAGGGLMAGAEKRFNEMNVLLKQIRDNIAKEKEALVGDAAKRVAQTLTIATVLFVGAIAIAATIAVIFARQIVSPLHRANQIAAEIAQGNLKNQFSNLPNDETGELMRSLERMQSQLNTLIGTIADGAQHIHDTSAALSGSASDLAGSSNQQSDRISSVAATVEELAVSVNHVFERVSSTRDTVREAASASESGLSLVTSAEQGLDAMTGTISVAVEDIQQLAQTSREINELANSIREIADQTNLLALNAAIEAARAGESGRGFAVVADEVRKLAEKTGSATSNIKSMLDAIAARTDHSVQTVSEVSHQANQCVKQIRELIGPLERIKEGAHRSLNDLEQLATGAQEQATAGNEVAKHMEDIATLTEKNNRTTHVVSAEASTMAGLAAEMASAVSRFKV